MSALPYDWRKRTPIVVSPAGGAAMSAALAPTQSYWGYALSSIDVDAAAYINALVAAGGSINDATRNAIIAFITTGKTDGWWSKMLAVYPYIGGTAATHAINAKTPGTYNITWGGTVTHNSDGITGDGSTGYGNTNFKPSLGFASDYSAAMGVYSRIAGSTGNIDMGSGGGAGESFTILTVHSSGHFNMPVNHACWLHNKGNSAPRNGEVAYNDSNNRIGIYIGTTTSASARALYKNGTQVATSTATDTQARSDRNIGICCRLDSTNTASAFTNRNHGFGFISSGLSAGDASSITTAIQTLQTALGR